MVQSVVELVFLEIMSSKSNTLFPTSFKILACSKKLSYLLIFNALYDEYYVQNKVRKEGVR